MRQGETASYEGYQVALFPMDYVYITQTSSPSSLSHCCGHPVDIIGSHAIYPMYAPCDCHRIATGTPAGGNYTIYASDDKVWTPRGLTYITFEFGHDDNIPSKTSFKQGELIAHTGTTPSTSVTGDHCHLDQSNKQNARLVSYGITCSFGNLCYALEKSTNVYDIFYLSGSENVVYTHGYTFETWQDTPVGSSGFKWWMARLLLERRRR